MLAHATMQDQFFTCWKYKLSWLMHAYATILNSGKQRWTKD